MEAPDYQEDQQLLLQEGGGPEQVWVRKETGGAKRNSYPIVRKNNFSPWGGKK